MFTGLVEGKGTIVRIDKPGQEARFHIRPAFKMDDLKIGDSIAVNGACLTVIDIHNNVFSVELSSETLSRTTFSNVQPGKEVNLERALRFGDRLGGHLVTGHIDTTGVVTGRQEKGSHIVFSFSLPSNWMQYLVEKGSVAIDGVSLTVNQCLENGFSVNIIPHTAHVTTLGQLKVGDKVNVETDLIGKYVARLLSAWQDKQTGLTEAFLKEHGFW
ncbi:MAG: riboflavin synthase [Candidatus Desulfofervidaceae bacterium]|nr:riboflavin synthase [Candidatus Desulfofervidaceae bacterium]